MYIVFCLHMYFTFVKYIWKPKSMYMCRHKTQSACIHKCMCTRWRRGENAAKQEHRCGENIEGSVMDVYVWMCMSLLSCYFAYWGLCYGCVCLFCAKEPYIYIYICIYTYIYYVNACSADLRGDVPAHPRRLRSCYVYKTSLARPQICKILGLNWESVASLPALPPNQSARANAACCTHFTLKMKLFRPKPATP